MEIRTDRLHEVIQSGLNQIRSKHGDEAVGVADLILTGFESYSRNDPDRDTKIASFLCQKINDGKVGFMVDNGLPTLTWNSGTRRLFELVPCPVVDLDNIFQNKHKSARSYIEESELARDILETSLRVHKLLGVNTKDTSYDRLKRHLLRTFHKVAQLSA